MENFGTIHIIFIPPVLECQPHLPLISREQHGDIGLPYLRPLVDLNVSDFFPFRTSQYVISETIFSIHMIHFSSKLNSRRALMMNSYFTLSWVFYMSSLMVHSSRVSFFLNLRWRYASCAMITLSWINQLTRNAIWKNVIISNNNGFNLFTNTLGISLQEKLQRLMCLKRLESMGLKILGIKMIHVLPKKL